MTPQAYRRLAVAIARRPALTALLILGTVLLIGATVLREPSDATLPWIVLGWALVLIVTWWGWATPPRLMAWPLAVFLDLLIVVAVLQAVQKLVDAGGGGP